MKWDDLSKGDQGLWIGVVQGWWEDVDMKRRQPIPFPRIVNVHDLQPHENTMAHVLAKAKVFPTISAARKMGWDKPIQLGEHWLLKRTVRVLVISVSNDEDDVDTSDIPETSPEWFADATLINPEK